MPSLHKSNHLGGLSPNTDLNLDINPDLNVDLDLALDLDLQQDQTTNTFWKALSKVGTFFKIGLSIPGMFVGGSGLGITSLFGEFAMDHFQDKLQERWAKKDWMTLIKHNVENLEKELLQALQEAKNVPKTVPKVRPNLLQTTSLGTNVYSHSYLDSLSYQEQIKTREKIGEPQQLSEHKKENIERNKQLLNSLKQGSEKSMLDNAIDGSYEGGFTIDMSQIPEAAVVIEDPVVFLIDHHYKDNPYRRFNERGLLSWTIPQFIAYLKRQYRIVYDVELYYTEATDADLYEDSYLIDLNEKVKNLEIEDKTTVGQLLQELGIDPKDPQSHFYLIPSSSRIDQLSKRFGAITGTPEIFTHPKVSESIKEQFITEFDKLYRSIANEFEYGGTPLHEIAYFASTQEFLSRNDKHLANGKLDTKWRAYLLKVWDQFKDKAIIKGSNQFYDSYKEVVDIALQGAILYSLIIEVKEEFRSNNNREINNEEVLEQILNKMKEPNIITNLLKGKAGEISSLLESFICESFIQFFDINNLKRVVTFIKNPYSRTGAFTEGVAFLDFMSKVLTMIYDEFKGEKADLIPPIFDYLWNPQSSTDFTGPRFIMRASWRILDGGLHSIVINDGNKLRRVSYFAPVKHLKVGAASFDIITDAITGALINAKDNKDSSLQTYLESELTIYLLNLRYKLSSVNSLEDALAEYLDVWFNKEFLELVTSKGQVKGPKPSMAETAIIEAINAEIIKNRLSKNDLISKMKKDFQDAVFIKTKIIDKFEFLSMSDITSIQTFIQSLANDIDSCYSDIGYGEQGSLGLVGGLSRGVIKRDYLITKFYLSVSELDQLGIKNVFASDGSTINPLNILTGQFKLITHKKSGDLALLETAGDNIDIPSDYIEGVLIEGQFVKNLLITESEGRLLLSKFFDPYNLLGNKNPFIIKKANWVKEEFINSLEDPSVNYLQYDEADNFIGVNLYTVFSYFEGTQSQDLGTLIHLTDPAFYPTNDLHYEMTELGYLFRSEQEEKSRKPYKGKISCNPFTVGNTYDLGKFTLDIFMKVFYNLFLSDPNKAQMVVMKYLDILNGISKGTDFQHFDPGPTISDVNDAINVLQFTEEQFNQFIYKIYNPISREWTYRFRDSNGDKFYLKDWLKLVYNKITSYTKDDGSKYSIQSKTLKDFSQRDGFENLFSQNSDSKTFTVEEARMAVEIFNSASIIFGEFTLRLIFLGMITGYGDLGNLGILVNSRPSMDSRESSSGQLGEREEDTLADYLNHIGLISSVFRSDRPARRIRELSRTDQLNGFLYGLFFLDAHIYLEIKGSTTTVKESYNTLKFNYGPLIALENAGSFQGQDITDLSSNIGAFFNEFASFYYESNIITENPEVLFKDFIKTQESYIKWIVKNKIRRKLGCEPFKWRSLSGLYDSVLDSIIYELKENFLDTTSFGIRLDLERFAKDNRYQYDLEFKTLDPRTSEPLMITITKDDLIQMGYVDWGTLLTGKARSLRDVKVDIMVSKVKKYLDDKIDKMGKGKAIFVPIFSTNDKSLGYQVLERKRESTSYNYLPSSGYFKVDKSDPNYDLVLEHIVKLTLAGACGFMLKKWNDNIANWGLRNYLDIDTEILFAFSRERIISPDELFSKEGSTFYNFKSLYNDYNNYHFTVSGYGNYPNIFRPTTREWLSEWIYPIVWSKGKYNTDLDTYMRTSVLKNKYLREILGLPQIDD